jgi:hypothetical protein
MKRPRIRDDLGVVPNGTLNGDRLLFRRQGPKSTHLLTKHLSDRGSTLRVGGNVVRQRRETVLRSGSNDLLDPIDVEPAHSTTRQLHAW